MLSKVMPKKSVAAVNLRTANRTLGGDLDKRGAPRTDGRRRNSTSARRSRTRGQRRPGRLSASHAARKGSLGRSNENGWWFGFARSKASQFAVERNLARQFSWTSAVHRQRGINDSRRDQTFLAHGRSVTGASGAGFQRARRRFREGSKRLRDPSRDPVKWE